MRSATGFWIREDENDLENILTGKKRPVKRKPRRLVTPAGLFGLLTVFELICLIRLLFSDAVMENPLHLLPLVLFIGLEWIYYGFSRAVGRTHVELEASAFFLTSIGFIALTGVLPSAAWMQLLGVAAGLVVYNLVIWFMGSIDRVVKYKVWVGVGGVLLLAANLIFGSIIYGAQNWIKIGPITFQPSEFVKIAFVMTGTATLDRLQSSRHLTWFLAFFAVCMGALFYMGDFGTACIFFVTFLVIAFLRSGDWKTLILFCAGAAAGAALILKFKPYIAKRFEAWRHVWEFADTSGYQQTQLLMSVASGGLLGLGPGLGVLHTVAASTTDLMFGVVCEEWGLLLGIAAVSVYVGWALFAGRLAGRTRSSVYSIAACAAASLLLFQAALNLFGVTDILPLTGVTLPFVSRGSSSMIACWGLLGFLKAADSRTYKQGRLAA